MIPTARHDLAVTGLGCISGFGVGTAAFARGLFGGAARLRSGARASTRARRASHIGRPHRCVRSHRLHSARQTPPHRSRRPTLDRVLPARARRRGSARQSTRSTGDDIGIALGSATAGLHTLVELSRSAAGSGTDGRLRARFQQHGRQRRRQSLRHRVRPARHQRHGRSEGSVGVRGHRACGDRAASRTAARDDHRRRRRLRAHVLRWSTTGSARSPPTRASGEASRPFDRRRNGFVLGCGAFLVVLESAGSAAARGARPLGHLAGWASTSSPCRPARLAGRPRRARCGACSEALAASGRRARGDVAVVFASANSSRELDRVEAEALEAVFGPSGVPVVAVKGAIGECGAAGGGRRSSPRALAEAGRDSRPRSGSRSPIPPVLWTCGRRRARSIRASRRSP